MTLRPSDVSAVLVTRGDVDLSEILTSLIPFAKVILWENSVEENLAVYGRYAALERVTHDVVYVQDDDCVLPPATIDLLLAAYEPGVVTANMSAYHQRVTEDSLLIGHGAIFDRDLPAKAFQRWYEASKPPELEDEALFLRTCDVIFTALTPRKAIDFPFRYLPWSSTDQRMWKQPGFAVEREQVLQQARAIARST